MRFCPSAHGLFSALRGQDDDSLCERTPFGFRLLVSGISHSRGTAPFALFALLLFRAPEVFTLRALLAFVGLTEDSHQFAAEPLEHKSTVALDIQP